MTTRRPPQHDPAVRDRLEHVVRSLGLLLEDVTVSTAGSQRVLRVLLDRAPDQPGSLSLDEVADAAREISAALDAADPMGTSPYTLEVSSPGVERPLTQPRHLRRNVGRLVLLTLHDDSELTGRVLSVEDDDTVVMLLAGAKKGMPATKTRRIAWPEVAHGVVQVEFNRPDDAELDDADLDDDEPDDDELDDDELDDDELDDEPDRRG